MLSKPPSSPPRQLASAGWSLVPSTSRTVLLYSVEFRRWTATWPGSTGWVLATFGSTGESPPPGMVALPPVPVLVVPPLAGFIPLLLPSITPVQATAPKLRASSPTTDRWEFVRLGILHIGG